MTADPQLAADLDEVVVDAAGVEHRRDGVYRPPLGPAGQVDIQGTYVFSHGATLAVRMQLVIADDLQRGGDRRIGWRLGHRSVRAEPPEIDEGSDRDIESTVRQVRDLERRRERRAEFRSDREPVGGLRLVENGQFRVAAPGRGQSVDARERRDDFGLEAGLIERRVRLDNGHLEGRAQGRAGELELR